MKKAASYIALFIFGMAAGLILSWPIRLLMLPIWGFEISSQRSFVGHHMARIYCKPGAGDQHLALEVDGARVWESPDLEPGDIGGQAVWDSDGQHVSLVTREGTIYTYDIVSKKGRAFIGKEADLDEH